MDEVCAVIGAGPGVGLAVARRFAGHGFRIGLVARRAAALERYAAQLERAGARTLGVAADVGDAATLGRALERIREQLGPVSVLVYNASSYRKAAPSTLSVDELVGDLRVNVGGALAAVRSVLPSMRAQRRGTILFTGGGLALNPIASIASLAIGKASLRTLALTLAEELEPAGIHVATVTIAGVVRRDSPFDPDRIADVYWQLHAQPREQWDREIVYR